MSKTLQIYRFTYTLNDQPREEFYTTAKEAEHYRDTVMRLANWADEFDALVYANVSTVRSVVVWNNVMTDEPVTA